MVKTTSFDQYFQKHLTFSVHMFLKVRIHQILYISVSSKNLIRKFLPKEVNKNVLVSNTCEIDTLPQKLS